MGKKSKRNQEPLDAPQSFSPQLSLLAKELEINKVISPELPEELAPVFLEELHRCLNPHVHEGKISPYGVALLRNRSLIERASKSVPILPQTADSMFKLSNGSRSLVAYTSEGQD